LERHVREGELRQPLTEFWTALHTVRSCPALASVALPVLDAHGLVASADVAAPRAVPGFRSSAMDGYAVRSCDCEGASDSHGVRLRVAGVIHGGGELVACPPQGAVKVMTGSRIPPGADAVVPWEDTDLDAVDVTVRAPIRPADNVRPADSEIGCGQLLASLGSLLGPPGISALVAAGVESVTVVPRPRVGLLTTGDELVAPGQRVGPGQVIDSNGPLVTAFVAAAGATLVETGRVGDDKELTLQTMRHMAARCDVVVTTGGISVGEHDWVRSVVEEAGRVEFWRVAMRPGKPLLYGHLDGTPVLCLPGNPTSVLSCCYLFLGPLLDALAGATGRRRQELVLASERVTGQVGRVLLTPGWVDDRGFRPLSTRHPGFGQMVATDGLAIVSEGGVEPGGEVPFVAFQPYRL
jgi:molybdenum cofactor synthesis domain-containing protein